MLRYGVLGRTSGNISCVYVAEIERREKQINCLASGKNARLFKYAQYKLSHSFVSSSIGSSRTYLICQVDFAEVRPAEHRCSKEYHMQYC